jgi:hypothetical protein
MLVHSLETAAITQALCGPNGICQTEKPPNGLSQMENEWNIRDSQECCMPVCNLKMKTITWA